MPPLDTLRILDTLERLKILRPAVFGAGPHGFCLNPRLSEADVLSFEQKHRVGLPPDYRQFLTELGNGGAGPVYGVFPLGWMDDNFGLKEWSENDGFVGVLSEPFVLEEAWNDLSCLPEQELADQNEAEYDAQIEVFDKTYFTSTLVNGAIPICHEGCALRIWLVLTGSQAGSLWRDRRSEYGGLHRLRLADGSPATFGRWYEQWLDECVAKETGIRTGAAG